MFWSLVYLVLQRILQLLVLTLRGDRSKEIEISYYATKSACCVAKYFAPTSPHQTGCCSPRCHD